jgi:hypothetical protein
MAFCDSTVDWTTPGPCENVQCVFGDCLSGKDPRDIAEKANVNPVTIPDMTLRESPIARSGWKSFRALRIDETLYVFP